jgi:hypothetical protein
MPAGVLVAFFSIWSLGIFNETHVELNAQIKYKRANAVTIRERHPSSPQGVEGSRSFFIASKADQAGVIKQVSARVLSAIELRCDITSRTHTRSNERLQDENQPLVFWL